MENTDNHSINQQPIPYTEPVRTIKDGWEILHTEESPESVHISARKHYVLLNQEGNLCDIDEDYWNLVTRAKQQKREIFSIVRMIPVVFHHYEKINTDTEEDTNEGERSETNTPAEGVEGAALQ